ncbi:unnamed protein product [Spirodela intermedia]|uniref:EF-hand domain-containing protein n=1 Tax=Spirodela intermedia TaxID=51605 RepID=A0A7I8JGC6_SPIIN|nr:unnamed protein product [Spirodela intermedia]CAA6669011.1 unnamed protein product [Spirodela intermedia]
MRRGFALVDDNTPKLGYVFALPTCWNGQRPHSRPVAAGRRTPLLSSPPLGDPLLLRPSLSLHSPQGTHPLPSFIPSLSIFLCLNGADQSAVQAPPEEEQGGDGAESAATSPTAAAEQRASTSRNPEEELQQVFDKFDSNGDGKISAAELEAILRSLSSHPPSPEELAHMMAEADGDGDGFISYAEFVELNTSGVGPVDAMEDLRQAFSIFDLDRNGAISADELARVLRGLGERASVAQCRRMIDGVDRDGDGLVSFEEFKVMMAGSAFAGSATAAPPPPTQIDD